MARAQQDRWRWLRSNLRGPGLADKRECGAQARVDASGQTGAQNGGDRATATAGQRGQGPCVSLSGRRNHRELQLRGHDPAGPEFGRAKACPVQAVFHAEHHIATWLSDSHCYTGVYLVHGK